jgi:hypothetical protein
MNWVKPDQAAQVVAGSGGPGVAALVVGAVEQVVDQVAAQPQLGLGNAFELNRSRSGDLHGKRQVVEAAHG